MSRATIEERQPMSEDESLEETEADLERARAQLQASLGALEDRLQELRDWRGWMRRRPAPFLLGAFALGALLGLRRP
jgi:hypothetical protein